MTGSLIGSEGILVFQLAQWEHACKTHQFPQVKGCAKILGSEGMPPNFNGE